MGGFRFLCSLVILLTHRNMSKKSRVQKTLLVEISKQNDSSNYFAKKLSALKAGLLLFVLVET